jgi:hypothetical protein
MAKQKTAVIGIYPTHASLEVGVQALKDAGFQPADISVLFPEDRDDKGSAPSEGEGAPEGAATGASAGAVVGGVLGWLAGVGSLVIPGMGPFVAAGPLIAALAGASTAGIVGGVAGGLASLGVPKHEADDYQARLKDGGTLLSVHSDHSKWTKRAREILENTGALDIWDVGDASTEVGKHQHLPSRSA